MGRRTRTIIADDDAEMRSAIVDVLESTDRFEVVASLDSGTALPETVVQERAELVVLDVRMPDGGAGAARRLRAMDSPPVVVAVSAHTDLSTVSELLRAGVSAYLAKGDLSEHFVDDLLRCVRGHVVLAVPHGLDALRVAIGGPETDPASHAAAPSAT